MALAIVEIKSIDLAVFENLAVWCDCKPAGIFRAVGRLAIHLHHDRFSIDDIDREFCVRLLANG